MVTLYICAFIATICIIFMTIALMGIMFKMEGKDKRDFE